MNLSHIIIKVNNLEKAVKDWQNRGFIVEYGKPKNPYNALVYFKEGPYIELFESCGMPKLMKKVMRFMGKKAFIDRMDFWDNHKEGLIGIEIENYKDNLDEEAAFLKSNNQGYFKIKSHRLDVKGRDLHFTCIFPDNMKIPALMSYFSVDPKPKTDIHPNGIKGIGSVSFGTDKKCLPLIKKLCNDERLKIFIGEGICDLQFIK